MQRISIFWVMLIFAVPVFAKMDKVDPNLRKAILDTLKVDGSEICIITMGSGDKIYIKFFPEDAPNTVKNFIMLANIGFYDSLTFHRVVPKFVVQGGDPLGNGTGGPGYTLAAEFNNRNHLLGTVAMARSQDPNSAGCQFYICLEQQPHLDKQYTIFGQVIKGMDVVNKIKIGDVMQSVRIERKSYDELQLLCKGMPESVIYTPPTPVSISLPDYPDELLNNGIEGNITLRIEIAKNGEVIKSKIVSSEVGKLNEEVLEKIVKSWVFTPAKIAGMAVSDWINVGIRFEITGRRRGSVSCLGYTKEVKKSIR